MTPGELLLREAAKWLDQAARDRNSAKALTGVEPSRSVFHNQQAAEKAIKGFLTFRGMALRKTHDLADLGSQCAVADPTLEPILRRVAELTDYATAFRYPDAPYEPDTAEAEEALRIAAMLCDELQLRIVGTPES